MKKLFLVKGDERHEVEIIDGRYNFCALGHMTTPDVAVLLGYELQEVNERRTWWIGDKFFHFGDKRPMYHTDSGKDWIRVQEILPKERIVSRDDLERAYSRCGYETKGNIIFNKLCRELGFEEGE